MSLGQRVPDLARGQYWIHPALMEVVENALLKLGLNAAVSRAGRHRIPVLEVGGTHVTAGWVQAGRLAGQRAEPARAARRGQRRAVDRAAGPGRCRPGGRAGGGLGDRDAGAVRLRPGRGALRRGRQVRGPGRGGRRRGAGRRRCPAGPGSLCFSNDASAFGVGEWLIGAARGTTRCVAVTLGTGVGSAFLDRGTASTPARRCRRRPSCTCSATPAGRWRTGCRAGPSGPRSPLGGSDGARTAWTSGRSPSWPGPAMPAAVAGLRRCLRGAGRGARAVAASASAPSCWWSAARSAGPWI